MGWIVVGFLATVVALVLYLVGNGLVRSGREAEIERRARGDRSVDNEDRAFNAKVGAVLKIAAVVVFLLWAVGYTAGAAIHQVGAGHSGVTYTFTNITGQTSEGLQFIAPWQSLTVASVQTQKYTTEDLPRELISPITGQTAKAPQKGEEVTAVPKGHVGAFSKETQDVFIKATLNLRVSPTAIQDLYRNIGPNWKDVIVAPRLVNFLKEETVRYDTVDIAPNREKIRTAVRDRLKAELAQFSIDAQDLLLDNIDFRSEFKAAIENKQIATQQALEEKAKVDKQRQIGFQAQAKAEGDAAAIRVTADANAYANRVLAESLRSSPEVIAYNLVNKLSPEIKTAILPAGQGFLIDLKSLGLGLTDSGPSGPAKP